MITTSDLAHGAPEGELASAALDTQSRTQLYALAKLGFAQGDYDDARDILQGLVVLNRQDQKAWALLGRVEHALKNLEASCDALTLALGLARKDWDTALELAEVHRELNEENQAQALLTYVTLEAHGLSGDLLKRLKALGGRR